MILQALKDPGSITTLPNSKYMPRPVTLWLHPNPPNAEQQGDQPNLEDSDNQRTDKQKDATDIGKKTGQTCGQSRRGSRSNHCAHGKPVYLG